jgi:hypothetical protein
MMSEEFTLCPFILRAANGNLFFSPLAMSAILEQPARIGQLNTLRERREELLAFWQAWKETAEEPIKAEALVKLMAELDHTIKAAAARFRYRGWAEIPFEDAYSIGRLAVLRSLAKYRPELGISIATFAFNSVKWVLFTAFRKLRRTIRFAEVPISKEPDSWEDPFVALTERTASFCFADTRAVTEFRLAIETYRAYAQELNASVLGGEVLRRLVEEGQPPSAIYGELYRDTKQAPPILLSKLLGAAVSLLHGALGGNRLSVRVNTLEHGAGCKWHQTLKRRKRAPKSAVAEQPYG